MWETIAISTLITLLIFIKGLLGRSKKQEKHTSKDDITKYWDHGTLKALVGKHKLPLPALVVELDAFDENVRRIVSVVRPTGKTVRIATKSLRNPTLIKRAIERGQGCIKGLMCYCAKEAHYLAAEHSLDDVFVAYPTVARSDLDLLLDLSLRGTVVCLAVDSLQHVRIIDKILGELLVERGLTDKKPSLGLVIDLDTSYQLGPFTLGAHRSRIRTVEQFAEMVTAIGNHPRVSLHGILGYEAHVAGLPDANPHAGLVMNTILRLAKPLFFRRAVELRKQVAKYCLKQQLSVRFFNGAGSGNMRQAAEQDGAITEVAVGSAFLQSQLFDYFRDAETLPAAVFALQATRVSADYITCQGGGFIASGSSSRDKWPVPFANAESLTPYTDEGFGETQTPLARGGRVQRPASGDGGDGGVQLGDPVFFRPAKAGEIAEHFHHYYLKKGSRIVDTAKTYRGLGQLLQ